MKRPLSLPWSRPDNQRQGKSFNRLFQAGTLALLAFLASSCAGVPEAVEPLPVMLPGDYPLYFSADTVENRELFESVLEGMLSEKQAADFLDRTERIYGGATEAGRFSLASEGNYPEGLIKMSLFFNRGYKKPGTADFWRNETGMEVGFSDPIFLLFSNGDMERMIGAEAGGEPQSEAAELPLSEAVIGILKSDSLVVYGRTLSMMGGLVSLFSEDLVNGWSIRLRKEDRLYRGEFSIDFSSERAARVGTTTLKLLQLTGGGGADEDELIAALLSSRLEREAEHLILKDLEISEEVLQAVVPLF